jgi:hypothetical protein
MRTRRALLFPRWLADTRFGSQSTHDPEHIDTFRVHHVEIKLRHERRAKAELAATLNETGLDLP